MLYLKMDAILTGLVAAGAGGSLVSGVLSAAGWFYKAATDNCNDVSIRQQVSESYLL